MREKAKTNSFQYNNSISPTAVFKRQLEQYWFYLSCHMIDVDDWRHFLTSQMPTEGIAIWSREFSYALASHVGYQLSLF